MKKMLLVFAAMLTSLVVHAETIRLTTKNAVILRGPITSESVLQTQKKLLELDRARGFFNRYEIYLVLDSPGGSIYDGLDLIETLKTLPNVSTISYFAASMAAFTVQAAPGRRLVKSNGIIMFHRASGGVQGTFETGELETQLEFHKKVVRSMERINATRMSITLEAYKASIVNERWVYGQDNVTEKSADSVVQVTCSEELLKKEDKIEVRTFFGNLTVKFSGCPELRSPIGVDVPQSIVNKEEAITATAKILTGGYRLR